MFAPYSEGGAGKSDNRDQWKADQGDVSPVLVPGKRLLKPSTERDQGYHIHRQKDDDDSG